MTFETCPLLDDISWIKHGFFGRAHAVTSVSHGLRTKTPYPVALGIPDCPLLFLGQERADTIITPAVALTPNVKADAAISDRTNLGLVTCTADCVPLLLVCTKTKQIANVHAGWQGTLLSIATKAVNQMTAKGADPSAMIASLGPSIHAVTYPVQDDVRDKFKDKRPETLDAFKPFEDRWCLNIPRIVEDELRACGIPHIWQSPTNTFTDMNYFSWRRRHTDPTCIGHWNASVIIKTY